MTIRNILSLVVLSAVCTFAQINLLSNAINFRTTTTAANRTYHYGDIQVLGGNGGVSWGWLYANRLETWNSGLLWISGKGYIQSGLDVTGNFNVISGTKNFIQPHPTDTTKLIKYIAIEAGEAVTLVRGNAKTIGGIAQVDLPEHFSLVTSSEGQLNVLITPKKVPVLLYTQEESKDKIVVGMKMSDYNEFGDAEFSWQVTGVRDGYENEEVIIDADVFITGEKSPNQVKALDEKQAKMKERVEKLSKKIYEMHGSKNKVK